MLCIELRSREKHLGGAEKSGEGLTAVAVHELDLTVIKKLVPK